MVSQITPDWERLTKHIEDDKETKDKLGWVREMYAWSIGAALQVSVAAESRKKQPICPP